MPRGASCRLYLDAELDRDSASVAMETMTSSIPPSLDKLTSQLKCLRLPHLVRQLNECPDTDAARLELDFADYLAACGARQRCQGDECTLDNINDVSMGALCPPAGVGLIPKSAVLVSHAVLILVSHFCCLYRCPVVTIICMNDHLITVNCRFKFLIGSRAASYKRPLLSDTVSVALCVCASGDRLFAGQTSLQLTVV